MGNVYYLAMGDNFLLEGWTQLVEETTWHQSHDAPGLLDHVYTNDIRYVEEVYIVSIDEDNFKQIFLFIPLILHVVNLCLTQLLVNLRTWLILPCSMPTVYRHHKSCDVKAKSWCCFCRIEALLLMSWTRIFSFQKLKILNLTSSL